jgi:hypothetical protein
VARRRPASDKSGAKPTLQRYRRIRERSREEIPVRIYGDLSLGNCLKVQYTCEHLGLAYTPVARCETALEL